MRYLVEAGRPAAALTAARACRAALWWCEALAGLALHAGGDFAGADSAFQVALRDMPPDERCRWSDVSLLLEGELYERYRRLTCEERGPLDARLWWLAQPLYALPGNDRRTEHFARLTMAHVEGDARTTYGLSWGDDLRQIMLRFGWPSYWTQETSSAGGFSDPLVVGHEPTPSVHFMPGGRAVDDPASARPDDWTLDAKRPRERYAPAYAASFTSLEHQAALFRRGDSALVVAAYDLSGDTLFANRSVEAALVLARDGHTIAVSRHTTQAGATDVLVAGAERGPLLFSLEVTAPGERRVARARYGIGRPDTPDQRVSLSDLLVFDPPDSLPTSLAGVILSVPGSMRVRSDRKLGLFWEIYGLEPAGEVVSTSLTLTSEHRGWLRRAAESLGLAARRSAVRLRWEEMPERHGSVAGRALAVDLSSLLPGRYRIELAIEATGQEPVTATRDIQVVRP